jgi:hypothetical protein
LFIYFALFHSASSLFYLQFSSLSFLLIHLVAFTSEVKIHPTCALLPSLHSHLADPIQTKPAQAALLFRTSMDFAWNDFWIRVILCSRNHHNCQKSLLESGVSPRERDPLGHGVCCFKANLFTAADIHSFACLQGWCAIVPPNTWYAVARSPGSVGIVVMQDPDGNKAADSVRPAPEVRAVGVG